MTNETKDPQDVNGQDHEAETAPQQPADLVDAQVKSLQEQVKEKEQKYLYLYADFENYKKRAIKERSDLMKFGWESTARELLLVIDNLERALAHVTPGTDKNLMAGLEMVLGQFRSGLERGGVTKIDAIGKEFDPNLHEAVGQESSDKASGHVVREELKGYLIHGRLLRPSKVVISSGK